MWVEGEEKGLGEGGGGVALVSRLDMTSNMNMFKAWVVQVYSKQG